MGNLIHPYLSFAAGFVDPTSVENLAAWYTARDSGSITVDGSDVVTEWADKSGNLNHAGPSGHTDPIYDGTDLINGIAAVNFDNAGAADTGLSLPAGLIRNLAGCTIIAVAVANSTARALHGFGFNGLTSGAWHDLQANTDWESGRKRVSGDTDQIVQGGTYTNGNAYIITQYVDWQNTTMRVRVNGSQVAESTTYQSSGNSADVDAAAAFLGMAHFDARSWRERIGEWMLYQRPLTAAEIDDIEAYLSTEWSITI